MIPTSIDGTDITGATIDGTDVQEITVDGDTVFTAGPTLPVAYSNLVAWYPFDSATYGGSDTDDVTAIIGGSGDDTAYDVTNQIGTNTHQSSGGVVDINAGASSGYYETTDNASLEGNASGFPSGNAERTTTLWYKHDSAPLSSHYAFSYGNTSNNEAWAMEVEGSFRVVGFFNDWNTGVSAPSAPTGWEFVAASHSSSQTRFYHNPTSASPDATTSSFTFNTGPGDFYLGGWVQSPKSSDLIGDIDDIRVYDRQLTSQEILDIYNNTEP